MALSPNILRQFLIWLMIGIATYSITITAVSDFGQMRASLASIGFIGWAGLIGLSTFNILLRAVRWQYYIGKLGYLIPISRNLQYFLAGFAFTLTPAKAGEAARSLYLKQDGVRYTDSLAALFVERLTDLIAVILLALAAVYTFEDYRWLVILAGACTLAMLPLIHSQLLRNFLARISERITNVRISKGLNHLINLINSSAALLSSASLYGGMVLSLMAAFSVCMMMYIVLNLFGMEISISLAVGIYATGILVGALSFLPGGLGSAEAVMIGLLVFAGVDITTATAATLICRIAALWYSIAVGIIIVLRLELHSKPHQEIG
ncbi:MAG: flippase-like domain-containing protein [Gammaproteobacteria bacterium]|nr:flippase-like domain-containing protein [Gammaproteobacteria bacterium]MCP4089977.1 flippase-like domain-containing protein [Gammaproteobacteria bacterium]MCP4276308.1 flippase-like domain-containing protein [Gammaproteobacteria bacterium]MCP4831303.1 flippase-like domain-containing protein [Gammaproteobacteria bacterium]MCP4928786.1 flippase-like domain-containing protein [Gammaproteobacteria bacterium]